MIKLLRLKATYGRVYLGAWFRSQEGMAAGASATSWLIPIHPYKGNRETELEVGKTINLKTGNLETFFFYQVCTSEGSVTSLDSATYWRSSVQIYEPVRKFSF